jgi:hypothetical protein
MNAPALMSDSQLQDYAAWLTRLARKARGQRLREFLAQAAAALSPWGYL